LFGILCPRFRFSPLPHPLGRCFFSPARSSDHRRDGSLVLLLLPSARCGFSFFLPLPLVFLFSPPFLQIRDRRGAGIARDCRGLADAAAYGEQYRGLLSIRALNARVLASYINEDNEKRRTNQSDKCWLGHGSRDACDKKFAILVSPNYVLQSTEFHKSRPAAGTRPRRSREMFSHQVS